MAAAGLTGTAVMAAPTREVTGPLAEQVAGSLKVQIDTVLSLEQASDGLANLAAGTARGKIVVTIAD